jgi:hypothetical protein
MKALWAIIDDARPWQNINYEQLWQKLTKIFI